MRHILTITRRELGSYFNSAIAYIYLIVFIAINNSLFMARYFLDGKADMKVYFDSMPLILLIFIPVITMRLWAEDKKEHTFEMLMTFPMRPAELVLGKFFASFIFYLISLVSTFTVPLTLYLSGKPDTSAIIGGYLGCLLVGTLFLAIGIFVSGLVKEQIIAFVITTLSCFVIFMLGTDFIAALLDGWLPGLGTFLMNHLGVASHLDSFGKGVIDLRDILYFTLGSAVFLLLNGLFLEGRLRPRAKMIFSMAASVCVIGVVVCNWLFHDFTAGRFDLTENKIYTVSNTTKQILKELKATVLLKLYITGAEKMPTAFKSLEQDITGKLVELKVASMNKFDFKVIHVEAAKLLEASPKAKDASKESADLIEKALQEKGIMPYQVESIDKDELGVKLVYSAITISYKEKKEEILPRILPSDLSDLEYLIFSRIMKLTRDKKPRIALFSPLKVQELSPEVSQLVSGSDQNKARFYDDEYKSLAIIMRNSGYEVDRIALTQEDPLPEGINTLLIINPAALNDRQLYEINKFLYQGGAVLVAAQGFDYAFQLISPSGLQVLPQKLDLGINKLIKKWGLSIDEDMLMDENSKIIEVTSGQRIGPFALSMPLKFPNQVVISGDGMNKNVPFVMRLPQLMYIWGSALDVTDETIKQLGLKRGVMLSSSVRSWKSAYQGGNLIKEATVFPLKGSSGKFPLAVLLEGEFSNTFQQANLPEWPTKDAAPVAEQSQQKEPAKKAEMANPKDGTLIVIGCSKMFTDEMINNPGNAGLFMNIVDGLTLGENIIKLRTSAFASRELRKISDKEKIVYRFINIVLIPLALALVALVRLSLRRRKK